MIAISQFQDLTGNRYGRLVVLEFAGFHVQPSGKRRSQWKCKCDCGNEVVVQSFNLKSGNSKSCGCYNNEKSTQKFTKHGGRHTRLYKIWSGMKHRCYCKSSADYADYGARGITVCDEWLNDFAAFRDWALVNGYDDTLSIDRIDVNRGYEPSNCRWATPVVQANNRRNTPVIDAHGQTKPLSEWAKQTGIKYHTLYARIYKLGIAPNQAIPQTENK